MLKEILNTYMKEENILSLSGLAERLDIPYKILKDINSEGFIIDQFFKETYGCGNDVYMQMMKDKLESNYKKGVF